MFVIVIFLGLQQFGVIPFEIRTLKKGHTEKWRVQSFYIAEIVRHRGTPLVRGETEDICEFY